MAAKDGVPERIVSETADLWFHCLVALTHFKLRPEDVLAELARREGLSGLAERPAAPRIEDGNRKMSANCIFCKIAAGESRPRKSTKTKTSCAFTTSIRPRRCIFADPSTSCHIHAGYYG